MDSPGVAPNNSFKPTPHRGVNSVLCATLHAVATPLRGGLTQALDGRKELCSCVVRNCDSSASVSVALRISCRRVATSFESVERAHTSRALSCLASETVIGLRSVCRSRYRRFRNVRLKVLGCAPRLPGFDFRQVHHGFTPASIYRHLTIRSSRPTAGWLNSGVWRQKSVV